MQKDIGFDFNSLDGSVNPTESFYNHVNNKWLAENPIPADQARWGVFIELHESTIERVREILQEVAENEDATPGSNEQKLRDFWRMLMDMEKRNELGITPLKEEFDLIDAISNTQEVQDAIAHLHLLGIDAFWHFGVGVDDKNPMENIAFMWQGGMGLPTRDYYFDDEFADVRKKYKKYIQRIFGLLSYSTKDAREAAVAVMAIETGLAKDALRPEEMRDSDKMYNKFTREQLSELAHGIDWDRYLAKMGAYKETALIVGQPDFFKHWTSEQLSSVGIKNLQHYLRFFLVDSLASELGEEFVDAEFDFHEKTLSGTEELSELWKRGVELTTSQLDHLISPLYVAQYFDENAKKHMEVLATNIKKALASRIERLAWMSAATKKKAYQKLEGFEIMVGYPDTWRNMEDLTVGRHSHMENILSARRFNRAFNLSKLGNPVDRKEWGMSAPTVNAQISFAKNLLIFPAGILQAPFFDPEADDAFNYGGIGAIIGHEAGHGFDDMGSKYDQNGVLQDWWDEEDKEGLAALAKLVVAQFNEYTVLDDLHVNGELTQGENIGDLGGLNMALEAYLGTLSPEEKKMKIGGFTPTQRFFLAWARGWRLNIKPELARKLINIDSHSPAKWRVNGPLSQMKEFHEAFGSEPGDAMYVAPNDRIVIW